MIALGCDHAGFELKESIVSVLNELGLEYKDCGTFGPESVDYPVYGEKAARAVASGECEKGIIFCGTGVGIGMAAGKVPGIRCATVSDCYSAKMSREHNDANMLSLGARVVGRELAKMIVRIWLTTEFDQGRHARRVGQIMTLDQGGTLQNQ
ncbi:MAG: ribose 5-phosphate isomerase B [Eubacteriales bacterium]|nr:ribose 5-phosphate isomerase B [Eubacteriales bacterium]